MLLYIFKHSFLVAAPILPFPDIALLTVVFETPSASATSDIVILLLILPPLSSKCD